MKKRKSRKSRVINWDNKASNVVRGSREPYALVQIQTDIG
jgi:hypothetical protein